MLTEDTVVPAGRDAPPYAGEGARPAAARRCSSVRAFDIRLPRAVVRITGRAARGRVVRQIRVYRTCAARR